VSALQVPPLESRCRDFFHQGSLKMEITESFFLERVWQRKGVYWKVIGVTNLSRHGLDYNATIECEQTFISEMDAHDHLRQMIINQLLIDLDQEDVIELDDSLYLHIVTEYKYPDVMKKRFLVSISSNPDLKIDEGEYISNVMDSYHWEQIV
jgi:hypothetical protein